MRTLCGRADLLRMLAEHPTANAETLASFLGYARPNPPLEPAQAAPLPPATTADLPSQIQSPPDDSTAAFDTPFWQPVRREYTPDAVPLGTSNPPQPARFDRLPELPTPWPDQPTALPPWPSLTPRPNLFTRLRPPLARRHPTGGPDIAAALHRLARAQQLDHLPRRRLRRWGNALQLIDDRSRRLTPFWFDQDEVSHWLSDLYPRTAITHGRYFEGLAEPLLFYARGALVTEYHLPPPGTPVLVMGDLGCLEPWSSGRHFWRRFGEKLRAAGCQPIALMPCGPQHWPADLARLWTMIDWEQFRAPSAPDISPDKPPVERLLRLLAPAIRVEPGLLRQIRRLPCARGIDASTEADFWQHSALSSPSSVAASFHPDAANDRRRDFVALPPEDQAAALACIRTWRATLSPDVWFEEILSLPEPQRSAISPADLEAAWTRFHNLSLGVLHDSTRGEAMKIDLYRFLQRVPRDLVPDLWPIIDRIQFFLYSHDIEVTDKYKYLKNINPINIPSNPKIFSRLFLYSCGKSLLILPSGEGVVSHLEAIRYKMPMIWKEFSKITTDRDFPFSEISSLNGIFVINSKTYTSNNGYLFIQDVLDDNNIIKTDVEKLTFIKFKMPSWASFLVQDRFGLLCQIAVNEIVQDLRWVPPGRYSRESSTNPIVVRDGYWIFVSPCSSEFYCNVMELDVSPYCFKDKEIVKVNEFFLDRFMVKIGMLFKELIFNIPDLDRAQYSVCGAGEVVEKKNTYVHGGYNLEIIKSGFGVEFISSENIEWCLKDEKINLKNIDSRLFGVKYQSTGINSTDRDKYILEIDSSDAPFANSKVEEDRLDLAAIGHYLVTGVRDSKSINPIDDEQDYIYYSLPKRVFRCIATFRSVDDFTVDDFDPDDDWLLGGHGNDLLN